MKKRILILVLALACLFSLASCKKETAYSLLNEADAALEAANGLEATVTIDMKMTEDGESEEQSISMDLKVNGENMAMVIAMDMYGETMEIPVVYVDGVMYMEQSDTKIKMEVSAEDFGAEYGSMGNVELPELTEEALKDVEIKKDGDTKSFTVSLDNEAAMEILGESLLAAVMGSVEDVKVDQFDITFTFTKDNTLSKMTMAMVLLPADEGEEDASLEATMTYEFKNLGTAPTIEAPADADEYLDMTATIQ